MLGERGGGGGGGGAAAALNDVWFFGETAKIV